ncbi:MAG: hypothetical protein VX589_10310 [Myxococcota bacterium]|nr:hypothetical protein [Myxococcota bacterium]
MTMNPSTQTPSAWRTVLETIEHYAETRKTIDRLLRGVDGALGDILFGVTTDDEKNAITRICYARTGHTTPSSTWSLAEWEHAWLSSQLPASPARILVCGCGWGREVMALRDLGYEAVGFDPAIDDQTTTPPEIIRADFDDFTAAALDGAANALHPLLEKPFDAILFGWGSLTHVLSPAHRARIFEAAQMLCPRGPLLGSAWLRSDEGPVRRGEYRRRVLDVAQRLARLRGLVPNVEEQFLFSPEFGFGVYIAHDELKAVAQSMDRLVDVKTLPQGHFTFIAPKRRRRKKPPRTTTQ